MRRRRGWRRAAVRVGCGAALAAVVGAASPLRAQFSVDEAGRDEITVDAESLSYDQRQDILSASGAVLIRRGDTTLRADRVELNRRTNEADAAGDAVLESPEGEIRAREMFVDLENETGELTDAQIYSRKLGYSLSGERIEKGRGHTYRIENGRFTTCQCAEGPPSWSIGGTSLDVELDGYGVLEDGTVRILDVPVFYLPRFAFPVSRERQSGLLLPRVGFSNRRGFQLLQPVYWAINKNQDATISLDVETSARLGLMGEYRYAFSRGSLGGFQAAYFNEAIRGQASEVSVPRGADPDVPENRWGVLGDHTQHLGSVEGYVDLLLVGDDLFLREINTFSTDYAADVDLRTRPFTTSRAGLLQRWGRAFVQGQATYYQDLVGPLVEVSDTETVERESLVIQRVPDVDFVAQKQLGYGVLGEMAASGTNFQRGRGIAGLRADLRPAAELRLPLGRSFFGTVNAALRETAYSLTESDMSDGFTGTDPDAGDIRLPGTSTREIVELRSDLGTEVARVFGFPHFGLDKIKHTIEPRLEYLYIPSVGQEDLPVFDGIDRINKRSLVTYGFASRVLGRTAPSADGVSGEVFEFLRVAAFQSYDFIRRIPPTSNLDPNTGEPLDPNDPGDHFSDIDFSLRVTPSRTTSVRAFSTYDASKASMSSATVGIRLKEPARVFEQDVKPRLLTRASFNVDYRFITDSIVQLLDSSMAVPLTDRIAFLYAMRYDINTDTFLENYFGVRLISACDCWALNLGLTETSNPNEVQVQAQLTLAGFGSTPFERTVDEY